MQPTPATSVAIVQQLRDRIARGELEPGAALRQESLAAEMGVSRLPIRDALAQLAAEGLVEIRANRGAYVATLTRSQCEEVFDLRVLLECDAMQHAMTHHTPRDIRAIKAVQTELEVEDDNVRWVEGDRRFHELLYAPSQRSLTLHTIGTLRNIVDRFYLRNLRHDDRRKEWKREHRDLIEAVESGNVERAHERLTAHLRATQQLALEVIVDTKKK